MVGSFKFGFEQDMTSCRNAAMACSSLGRVCKTLCDGAFVGGERSSERCFSACQAMGFDLKKTPGTTLKWTLDPETWKDPTTIGETLVAYVFDNELPLAGRLCETKGGAQDLQMCYLPWRPLCEHVLRHGKRPGAPALTTAEELKDYLRAWSHASMWVRDILEWKYTASEMCDISRLGAWLGDVVNTELRVRAHTHRSGVQYVVVHNSSYKVLGKRLGLASGTNSSDNNVGNLFEHLMWLALEEHRCEWILGVLRWLAVHGTPHGDADA